MGLRTLVAAILTACGVGCSRQASTPTVSTEGLPPMEAIKIQLAELQNTKGNAWINIEEIGGDALIQISGGDSLGLNITYYPSKEGPEKALGSVGITVPSTWQQVQFEPETVLLYEVPAREAESLPSFINDLFVKFFRSSPDYKVHCYIETM